MTSTRKLSWRGVVVMLGGGLLWAGCTPPEEPDTSVLVNLPLSSTGELDIGTTGPASNAAFFDVSDQTPGLADGGSTTILLDAEDIRVRRIDNATTNAVVNLLLFWSGADAADPCAGLPDFNSFDILLNGTTVTEVIPTSSPAADGVDAVLRTGRFGLCLAATSADAPLAISIGTIGLRFEPPGEVVVTSCEDILALNTVQAAIAELAAADIEFSIPGRGVAADVMGDFALTQTTTFDPDGQNIGDVVTGDVVHSGQTSSRVRRTGFGASVDLFLQGTADEVGLCVLQATGNPACDQTIARLESLTIDDATGSLNGTFLSVVVRRNSFTNPGCGAAGDFVYGTLDLAGTEFLPSLVDEVGRVALPAGYLPDLARVTEDGAQSVVSDALVAQAVVLSTDAPFNSQAIVLPEDLADARVSAIGLSDDPARIALVTDLPGSVLTYDAADLSLIRQTSPTQQDIFIGEQVDFDAGATRVYVSAPNQNFANGLSIMRTDDSVFGDQVRRFSIPQGKLPLYARLSPDGSHLPVLVDPRTMLPEDGVITEASELVTISPDTEVVDQGSADLVALTGGTVAANQLVWSADSSRYFLAGIGAVMAVDANDRTNITPIDVSGGTDDNPLALALSGDGAVLVVTIADVNGVNNFAVVDASTLEVLDRQRLPGIPRASAVGVAHFGSARLAMVAAAENTVVAVQTEAPYAPSAPISVNQGGGAGAIGVITAGGDRVAVTNLDEPSVYFFRPADPR